MAFQPIVDTSKQEIFAYEALVRGIHNEPAGAILAQVNDHNRYRFDQACRVRALAWAAKLNMPTYLSINFLPNAVYRPETCIRATIEASQEFGFPLERLIFEITEGEEVEDHTHLQNIIQEYKRQGFLTAIDDFGAGYSGLNLLAELETDLLKLDMAIIREIDQDPKRQSIVRAIVQVCQDLAICPIAEGVETRAEWQTLAGFGIELFQGFYFARPVFESLAVIDPQIFNMLSDVAAG
ncbi:MAG: EAL domain-containing protein [Spirulina sp. SIO3F2]|nr:EAL domain-containing protein [Spirulina sp. SIO3F2]